MDLEPDGKIIVHQTWVVPPANGSMGIGRQLRYEIIGKRGSVFQMSCGLLDEAKEQGEAEFEGPSWKLQGGERLRLGPYKFIVAGSMLVSDHLWVVQDTIPGRVRVLRYRASRLADLFWRRLIVTLSVWGLADRPAECYPSAGDIHLLQWLKKLRGG